MNIIAFGMPGGLEILIVLLSCPIIFVIPALAFWKICSKAGFPGPLGLLMLVPVANIVLLLYLAFADWPALNSKTSDAADVYG
jgi:hypothetical protein